MKLTVCCFLLLLFRVVEINAQEWIELSNEDGLKLSQLEKTHGDINEYKVEFDINSSLSGAISLLKDVESYSEWISGIDSAYKDETLCEDKGSTFCYRFFIEIGLLVKKDGATSVKITQNIDNSVSYTAMLNNNASTIPRYTRLKAFNTKWKFDPLSARKTSVTYVGVVDYGSSLGEFFLSKFIENGLKKSMKKMRHIVMQDKYQNNSIDFINNLN